MKIQDRFRATRAPYACVLFLFALFSAQTTALIESDSTGQKKAKPIEVSSDQFLWRVDLHSMGYPDNGNQLQGRRDLDEFDTVDFVSEGVVAASFITQEPTPPLEHRGDPNGAPLYRLHAVFLGAASGKVLRTLDWPLENPYAGIFPLYDGRFLFLSTQRIVLYSADWTPVKELPLPQLQQPHSYLAGIAESPSGKVLVIRFHQGSLTQCIRILTDSLEGAEEPCEITEQFTVSDEAMATSRIGKDRTEEDNFGVAITHDLPIQKQSYRRNQYGILIREMGKDARILCFCYSSVPQFINNQMIAAYSGNYLWLLSVTGDLKFGQAYVTSEDSSSIDNGGRPVRPSADGRRFALALNIPLEDMPIKGMGARVVSRDFPGDPPATFPDRVDVFDLPSGQWVYILRNKKSRLPKIMGLGLSPGGEMLTIDSGGVIQVYALPPASSTSPSIH